MATKGASNRYGNPIGGYSNKNPRGVNYEWAKKFNNNSLKYHFEKHGKELGIDSVNSYEQHAIKFANTVDKKNFEAHVDQEGKTYKINKKTGELVIVNKNGTVITYYKVKKGFKFKKRKGIKRWRKKK